MKTYTKYTQIVLYNINIFLLLNLHIKNIKQNKIFRLWFLTHKFNTECIEMS